jgi:hypothetical protein
MRLLAATLAFASLLSIPAVASAAADYSYAGNSFETIGDDPLPAGTYTTEMRITGSFELASELGPNLVWNTIAQGVLSYSFTDGRNRLTEVNSRIVEFMVSTDGSGKVRQWSIYIAQDLDADVGARAGNIRISYGPSGSFEVGWLVECLELDSLGDACSLVGIDVGEVRGLAGVVVATVPEPSTASLLGLFLAGIAAVRRRHMRSPFPDQE